MPRTRSLPFRCGSAAPQRNPRSRTTAAWDCRRAPASYRSLRMPMPSASSSAAVATSRYSTLIPRTRRFSSDALNRHGPTPVIVRSGSGNYQAWYRHKGERRSIRPWPGLPIDLLGGGYVVAPPSISTKGQYQFLQGSLDDLHRLPVLRNADVVKPVKGAKDGERGEQLFRHCMKNARHVDSFDDLRRCSPNLQRQLRTTDGGGQGDINREIGVGLPGAW